MYAAVEKLVGECKPYSLTGTTYTTLLMFLGSLPLVGDLQASGFDVQVTGFGRIYIFEHWWHRSNGGLSCIQRVWAVQRIRESISNHCWSRCKSECQSCSIISETMDTRYTLFCWLRIVVYCSRRTPIGEQIGMQALEAWSKLVCTSTINRSCWCGRSSGRRAQGNWRVFAHFLVKVFNYLLILAD